MKKTLNLLPVEQKEKKKKGIAFYAALGTALYLLTVIGSSAYNIAESGKLGRDIDGLEKKASGMRAQVASYAAKAAQTPLQPSPGDDIRQRLMSNMPWARVLAEMSAIVPDKAWLSTMDIKEEPGGGASMSIKGLAKDQLTVAELIARLEASRYFSDVEIVFSQQGDKDAAFELKAKVRWT